MEYLLTPKPVVPNDVNLTFTVREVPNFLEKLLGCKERVVECAGHDEEWREKPSGTLVNGILQILLYESYVLRFG